MKERNIFETLDELVKNKQESDVRRITELGSLVNVYTIHLNRYNDAINKYEALLKELEDEKKSVQIRDTDIFAVLDKLVDIETRKQDITNQITFSKDKSQEMLTRIKGLENEIVKIKENGLKSADVSSSTTAHTEDTESQLRKLREEMEQERSVQQNVDPAEQLRKLREEMEQERSAQQNIDPAEQLRKLREEMEQERRAQQNIDPAEQLRKLREEMEQERPVLKNFDSESQVDDMLDQMENNSSDMQEQKNVVNAAPEVIEAKRKELEESYQNMLALYARVSKKDYQSGDTFLELVKLKNLIGLKQYELRELGELDRSKLASDMRKEEFAEEFIDATQLMMLERDKAVFEQKAQSMVEKQSKGMIVTTNENVSLMQAYGQYYSNLELLIENDPDDPEMMKLKEEMDEATALVNKLSENYFNLIAESHGETNKKDAAKSNAEVGSQAQLEDIKASIESIKVKLPDISTLNDLQPLREELSRYREQLEDLLSKEHNPRLLKQLFSEVNDLLVQAQDQEQLMRINFDFMMSVSQETIDRIGRINNPEALQALRADLEKKQQKADVFDLDIDSAENKDGHNDWLKSAISAIDEKLKEIQESLKTSERSTADIKQHRVP